MRKWLCLPGKFINSGLAISLSTTSCAHIACGQKVPLPPAPCWCEGRMWSWRCSSAREHTLPNAEPGLLLWLLYTTGCLLQWLDMSDEPLPISSEFDGTAPTVLVAAGIVLFTHTSPCVHARAHIQIFLPLHPCQCRCGSERGRWDIPLPLCPYPSSGKGTKRPLGSSQQWGPHRRGALRWVKPACSWLYACSW